MNGNQMKGEVKAILGRVQEAAGHLTGSKMQQVKGLAKQCAGRAQSAAGDVEQAVKDWQRR